MLIVTRTDKTISSRMLILTILIILLLVNERMYIAISPIRLPRRTTFPTTSPKKNKIITRSISYKERRGSISGTSVYEAIELLLYPYISKYRQ